MHVLQFWRLVFSSCEKKTNEKITHTHNNFCMPQGSAYQAIIRNNYSIYWVRVISTDKVSHTYWGELEELQVFMDEQNG